VATGLDDNRRYGLNLTTTELLPGSSCCFIEVATRYYHGYVGFARWFYRGKPFPLYQIVWPRQLQTMVYRRFWPGRAAGGATAVQPAADSSRPEAVSDDSQLWGGKLRRLKPTTSAAPKQA
jgi:hypothetical protein